MVTSGSSSDNWLVCWWFFIHSSFIYSLQIMMLWHNCLKPAILLMFPTKQWWLGGLKKVLRKVDETGKHQPWAVISVEHAWNDIGERGFRIWRLHRYGENVWTQHVITSLSEFLCRFSYLSSPNSEIGLLLMTGLVLIPGTGSCLLHLLFLILGRIAWCVYLNHTYDAVSCELDGPWKSQMWSLKSSRIWFLEMITHCAGR